MFTAHTNPLNPFNPQGLADDFYPSSHMKGAEKGRQHHMTITVDDAGCGDLLFGVIIGAFREETQEFTYGIIDVKYFQTGKFHRKEYLEQSSRIVSQLISQLNPKTEEQIHICQGYIFDEAVNNLKKTYGNNRIQRVKVTGEPQRLTETAYLDEIRNLGYEPLQERETKRAKSFFHMLQWLQKNPERLKYAKTGWPRLSRYRLFRRYRETKRRHISTSFDSS